jgi:aldehyde:ferredoxin oxidoreductase
MQNGYNGKILHINLTTHQFKVETPDENFYRKYLGGSALNLYYLLTMVPKGIDPLGADNVFAVSVSVTTGAPFPGNSRVTMSAKSPLTGLMGDSQAGGFFPAEMKFSGFDAFIFTGQSPTPVYLWVNDGEYELRDASHLWGLETGEVEDLIYDELEDKRIQIAQIGPAGENLVRYANVLNMCNRANGRTGMGAVMGSKKLRAIALRGKQGRKNFKLADPDEFRNFARGLNKTIRETVEPMLGRFGTAGGVPGLHQTGMLPTKNSESGVFSNYEKISGNTMYEQHLRGASEGKQDSQGRDTCYACPVRCKRVVEYENEDLSIDPRYGGPEYETVAKFGSECEISDFYAIAKANEMCSRYGLDTISCGGTIAWAMDCFEKGILTTDDTDGIKLNFGNSEALLQLIDKIAKREGFGDILAEGSYRAAMKIGKDSVNQLLVANKQEFPAHMPRVKRSLGLIYAVNPFGADHMSSGHDPMYEKKDTPEDNNSDENNDKLQVSPPLLELGLTNPTPRFSLDPEKIRFARLTQNQYSLLDSLCICMFVANGILLKGLVKIIKGVVGWNTSIDELLTVGERRVNMMRLFNAREGYTKEMDVLPKKMYQPLKGGTSDGLKMDPEVFEEAKQEYYAQRGWDPDTGNPTLEKIKELGLEWAVEE